MKMLLDYKDGEHIAGQFLVGNVIKGTNNLGAQYFNIELRDASGTMSAKKWEIYPEDEDTIVTGNVIDIDGEVYKYRDSLQIKLLGAKKVDIDDVDVTKFLKQPPIPTEELVKKFNSYVDSIKQEDCKKLLDYFINKYKDKLYDYPAATFIHHEYHSGLLVHSITMAGIADYLAPIYDVDRDLIITAVLLHDFGKFTELKGPIIYKYSTEGKLLGHISIMAAEIKEAADKLNITSEIPLLLEHCILSHHGQYEFGSPVLPLTKEAMLLSLIDNLDSKMVIVNKALEETEEGEFSDRVNPLDGRMLYKHK